MSDELSVVELLVFSDYEDEMREFAEQSKRDSENSNRILQNLKRKLSAKLWEPIEWELKSHYCLAFGVVAKSEVKGRKEKGCDYFCQSTAIRHVYTDVSSCSYSDSYGGNIYIRLGDNRYLAMYING